MRKIFVTGVGIVSPVGNSIAEFLDALLQGRTGVGINDYHDTTGYRTNLVGRVRLPDWKVAKIHSGPLRRLSAIDRYALVSVAEALAMAGLSPNDLPAPHASGIVIGNGAPIDGLESFVLAVRQGRSPQPSRLNGYTESTGALVSREFGLRGPRTNIMTACSSGATALGFAADMIRTGHAELMLAGGVECLSHVSYSGFNSLEALSPGHSRPFHRDRDGINIGEGAGFLVLESEEHAKARGAKPLAEFLGYGISSDAHHMTAPHPSGAGMVAAMHAALVQAGVRKEAIGYINMHGTGTRLNDSSETRAIKEVFGTHANSLCASSIKPMIGHCLCAVGAMEAVATVLALQHQMAPPTLFLDDPDPECDLDFVPLKSRKLDLEFAMTNSLAFGGNNTSLILGRTKA